ncbi:MAG: WG repeat-containing protein [Bacteroidota bacterium]
MKKISFTIIVMSLLFSIASCSTSAGNSSGSGAKAKNQTQGAFEWPDNEGLYPIVKDGLYGYINTKGEVVIKPQFERAAQFSEGLAYFEQGDKFGFINPKGEVAIPAIYEKRKSGWWSFDLYGESFFSEGLAVARVDGKLGYINQKGEMVITPKFVSAEYFHDGLAVVSASAGSGMYYINKKGEQQFGKTFERAMPFSDSLAGVMVDEKMGFINTSGKMVIAPQYYTVGEFIAGYTVVRESYENKTWKLIDKTGKTILEKQVDRMRVSGENLLCFGENLNEGYMDFKGKVVVPANFDMVMGFFSDIAIAKKDSKEDVFGIINRKGEWIVEPTYHGLWPAGKNMITVITESRELGYIDASGKEIWKPSK